MPETGKRREASASDKDRISALPDALLLHTLSLLPSNDAVRTCVLARRWQYLWRYSPSLQLIHDSKSRFRDADHFNKFVSHLIVLRDRSPLVQCKIDLYPYEELEEYPYVQAVQMWIHYALACQVQVLNVTDDCGQQRLLLNVPFISRHLTILEHLHQHEKKRKRKTHFWDCPELENLEVQFCSIYAPKMASKSLKRLCIDNCCFMNEFRTRISVPSLISLRLDDCGYRTPLLDSMPLLETAFIRLDDECDCSSNLNCGQQSCHGCYGFGGDQCVLLNGLSNATTLELIALPEKFIFRRDVAWCPTFCRLKTLLLNDWCVAFDLQSLDLVSTVGVEGHHDPELSSVCAHLKVANIECKGLYEKVHKVWNMLRTCGIVPEKICIKTRQSSLNNKFTIVILHDWLEI
ncbi:hypothetical protein BRADI_4g23152v3 [Brachypodium distachyon]|uniref:F-box domain-containing protein n=1 Tax=Brachypodium distachyon TaxID=15368 RepID=A0A0Q3H6I1_BRADI|nr:hypothetical protein BRADI_4g23152v3 [Brachypodium distachyon]